MSLLSKLSNLIWYGALAFVAVAALIATNLILTLHPPMNTILPVFYVGGLILTAAGIFKLAMGGRRRAD